MEVYRITLASYADKLHASGKAGRWNTEGKKIIYTAASRSLACLENVVHRSNRGLNTSFKVMVIYVPDALFVESINPKQLPDDWFAYPDMPQCRSLGDAWLQQNDAAALKVPSAIIPYEYNYLLNPLHQHFDQIKIIAAENFRFDKRIKDS